MSVKTILPVITCLLAITIVGHGAGTVTGSGTGFSGSGAYPLGSTFSLVASPAPGSEFVGWGGSCSGATTCNVTLNSNQSVTAEFEKIPAIQIAISQGKVLAAQILAIGGKGTPLPTGKGLLQALRQSNPKLVFGKLKSHKSPAEVGVVYVLSRSNSNAIFLEEVLPGKPARALITEIRKNGSIRTFTIRL